MSTIVPPSALAKVEFYEVHNAPFSANAVAIGTTAAAVTALNVKTVAARTAYATQQSLHDQAKAATQNFKDAVVAMQQSGSEIIKSIKAKAAVSGNGIYTLAQLPVPAIPAPVPAPGLPEGFSASLDQLGALTLKWKCVNPPNAAGPVYEIARQIGTTGNFIVLGLSGVKNFTDTTLPPGAGSGTVSYRVIAVRSTARGAAGVFTVRFGTSGGVLTASVVEGIKMAA